MSKSGKRVSRAALISGRSMSPFCTLCALQTHRNHSCVGVPYCITCGVNGHPSRSVLSVMVIYELPRFADQYYEAPLSFIQRVYSRDASQCYLP